MATNKIVEQAVQYINQHYSEKISLKQLSKLLYVNPGYLGRTFEKEVGTSFSDYMIAYRLNKAILLLRNKMLPVQSIANLVGFSSSNYFYNVFKERMGVTPLSYRRSPFERLPELTLIKAHSEASLYQYGMISLWLKGENELNTGAILALPTGLLQLYYVERSPTESSVLYVESADDGDSWSDPYRVFSVKPEFELSGLNVLEMLDGSIGMFYTLRTAEATVLFCRRSNSNGRSFEAATQCCSLPREYSLQNGRVIKLTTSNRSMIAPFVQQLYAGKNIIWLYRSDNDGLSWHALQTYVAMNSRHTLTGMVNPVLMEFDDGSIHGWAATDMGRQYEYVSHDGGERWTPPHPSYFSSSEDPMAINYIARNRILAVLNPIPHYISQGEAKDPESDSRLIYCVSIDHGTTWEKPVVLEGSEHPCQSASYNSPYIHAESAVFIAYHCIRRDNRQTSYEIILRKIDMKAFG